MVEQSQENGSSPSMVIAIVVYDGMTTLDAVGPMEILRFIPGARIEIVGSTTGLVRTDVPSLELIATASFAEVDTPDVVLVPGGPGTSHVLDGDVVDWLRRVHVGTRWTTSVCSGSLILGAAGLLDGIEATSHFGVVDLLDRFGATPSRDRVVVDRERGIITCAGVSSGIDMALTLAAELADEVTARAIQLLVEYDPHPPFHSGSLDSATDDVIERAVMIGSPHGAIPSFWVPPSAPAARPARADEASMPAAPTA